MDISSILSKLPNNMQKAAVVLGKHAPDIMTAFGAGMVIGGAILACKQTIEAHDILEQAEIDMKAIEKAREIAESDYTDKDAQKDRVIVYTRTSTELVKTYAPAAILGLTGLGLMIGAHKILKDRNATLALAYSNLLTIYNGYRNRVIEAIGEDKEFQLRSGYTKEEIDYLNENEEVKHAKNAKVVHDNGVSHSPFARVFDESCTAWSVNPSSNLIFLRSQQQFANDKLRAKGVLFLNEVYEDLGFPRTPEGQLVGWVFDPDNPNIDSYVDFGIYDTLFKSVEKRDFINGYEPCIWLDFNVDGMVYEML